MSIATLSSADALILMITESDLLTDEQKDLFIDELTEGRIHPELEAKMDMIVARETELAELELAQANADHARNAELLARAQEEADAEAPVILSAFQKELEQTTMDHTGQCRTIENQLDKDIEGMVREKKDDSEADAIRQMLQQKP